jgi:hypothetical protein
MKRLAVATSFAVLATISGSAFAFSDAASATGTFTTVASAPLVAVQGTTTTLSGSGSKVVFTPNRLTGVPLVPTSECSTSEYSFSIVNSTARSQKVTIDGALQAKISPEQGTVVCLGTAGKYTFTLRSSPSAVLKVVVTASSS